MRKGSEITVHHTICDVCDPIPSLVHSFSTSKGFKCFLSRRNRYILEQQGPKTDEQSAQCTVYFLLADINTGPMKREILLHQVACNSSTFSIEAAVASTRGFSVRGP